MFDWVCQDSGWSLEDTQACPQANPVCVLRIFVLVKGESSESPIWMFCTFVFLLLFCSQHVEMYIIFIIRRCTKHSSLIYLFGEKKRIFIEHCSPCFQKILTYPKRQRHQITSGYFRGNFLLVHVCIYRNSYKWLIKLS